jgi:hypothetical protein
MFLIYVRAVTIERAREQETEIVRAASTGVNPDAEMQAERAMTPRLSRRWPESNRC